MLLAHKIRLKPNKSQDIYLRKACGVRRKAYNWALDEWDRLFKLGLKPTAMSLKKSFNSLKRTEFPYVLEVTKCAAENAILDVGKAYTNFFAKRANRPKYKKKFINDSFRINNDQFSVEGNKIRMPKLGAVKMYEKLRFEGKIMSATVSRKADYWFISILVDTDVTDLVRKNQGAKSINESYNVVGIDLGIKCFAQLSTYLAEAYYSPKPLKRNLKKLKRLQRSFSRKEKGSANRRKAAAKVAKLHYRISCARKDFLNKLTSKISKTYDIICIEDLSTKWMLANRHLSRTVSDLGFYEFRRQLEYKQNLYGTYVNVVSRFYPSTKTCSNCGCINKKIQLKDRTYVCTECGFEIDRDFNAALNLKRAAEVSLNLPKVLREVKPVDCVDPHSDAKQLANCERRMNQEVESVNHILT